MLFNLGVGDYRKKILGNHGLMEQVSFQSAEEQEIVQ